MLDCFCLMVKAVLCYKVMFLELLPYFLMAMLPLAIGTVSCEGYFLLKAALLFWTVSCLDGLFSGIKAVFCHSV